MVVLVHMAIPFCFLFWLCISCRFFCSCCSVVVVLLLMWLERVIVHSAIFLFYCWCLDLHLLSLDVLFLLDAAESKGVACVVLWLHHSLLFDSLSSFPTYLLLIPSSHADLLFDHCSSHRIVMINLLFTQNLGEI